MHLVQYKLTLDKQSIDVFRAVGDGNASLGARTLAHRASKIALAGGLSELAGDALQSLAEAAGVSPVEVVEQLVLEARAQLPNVR